MSDWDKLLVGLLVLAIIAVVAASSQTSTAITSIGTALQKFSQNVVGTGQKQQGQ